MAPVTRHPVIITTAMDGDEDELRGLVLGAVDYLTKPFEAGRGAGARARTSS